MKKITFTICLFFICGLSVGQSKPATIQGKLEIPATQTGDVIINHTGYSLLYNEKHEQASWVAYELTEKETNKLFERSDKFLVDPKVSTGSATSADYKESGYDRGHLAPAADMSWSELTMVESFYYSNMSPQLPGFNRGIWKSLEELVRSWAIENNSIYVVTGPVLSSGLKTIGVNGVSVPNYYYKVILDYSESSTKAIGFILPNQSSDRQLQEFAVSVDSVEKVTGIDFYYLLPDDQEASLESSVCVSCWSWKKISSNHNAGTTVKPSSGSQTNSGPKSSSGSVQCSGTTQAGNRCKRMTTNANGRCYQHQ